MKIPTLSNSVATYDLVVIGAVAAVAPYSTEDWTLQLNCSSVNTIQFEDAGTITYKLAGVVYPTNTWLYFVLSMNTTNMTMTGSVYNATNWNLLTSYTQTMQVSNLYVNYWLFGNNEAGSQAGLNFYYSGLWWTNYVAPTPPPYTYATNQLVCQYKFNGDLTDASLNGNTLGSYGTFGFVSGENGTAPGAVGVTNATLTASGATNPVSAITVSYWINTSSSGMPIARAEFTSWFSYVNGDGTVQFNLVTTSGNKTITSASSLAGAWHLFTATWDGHGDSLMRIYIDGVLSATAAAALTGTIVQTSTAMTVGSGSGGYALGAGWLDDVRVYGRALNASEIAAIFAAGADGNINL